jgi:hypothetical protein
LKHKSQQPVKFLYTSLNNQIVSEGGVENIMTDDVKGMAGKAAKAKKASDKATEKMHSDVTKSLDQLEHPGAAAQKVSEDVKTSAHKGAKTAAHGAGSKKK